MGVPSCVVEAADSGVCGALRFSRGTRGVDAPSEEVAAPGKGVARTFRPPPSPPVVLAKLMRGVLLALRLLLLVASAAAFGLRKSRRGVFPLPDGVSSLSSDLAGDELRAVCVRERTG